jgi:TRAP-type C4-dicarboxylate transport system substrate-binding protein
MIVVASDIIDDLTPAQRFALVQCGGFATRRSREVSAQADREGLAWLRARGMVVIDDVDKAAFLAAVRPDFDRLCQRINAEPLARLIKAAG